jgi:hypothetical protein
MNNTDVADNLVSMMNSPVIMMIDEFGFVVKRQL